MDKRQKISLMAVLMMLLASCSVEDSPMQSAAPSSSLGSSQLDLPVPEQTQQQSPAPKVLQEDKSYIFVQRDTDATDDGVSLLMRRMASEGLHFYRTAQHPKGLIGADDVVLLKINAQWAQRGGTNTDLIRAVAELVAAHPDGFTGEIIIADNGQGQYGTNGTGGSLTWSQPNSANRDQNVMDVINTLRSRVKISGYLWDTITMNRVGEYDQGDYNDGFVIESEMYPTGLEVSYPKFTTEYGTQISFKNGIWNQATQVFESDKLKVINLPVLKYHNIYHVTGAVKSYMGVVANRLTDHRPHFSVGKGGMGTLMAQTRMPVLNIMDMVWVGTGNGPGTQYSDATQSNMLAASTDPVALDYWAAKYVLLPHTTAAGVDPDDPAPGSFGHWLRLSAQQMQNAGLPARLSEADMLLIDSHDR